MNQAVPGGANSLTGGATTAPGMLASSGRTATATTVPSGPTMANQGTGLGDLLTHDEPAVSGTHVSVPISPNPSLLIILARLSTWRPITHSCTMSDLIESRPCWVNC